MENPKLATNSMLALVKNSMVVASTGMFAKNAASPDMERKIVRMGASEIYGLQSKYLCHNLWQEGSELSPTTAEWSEQAHPLPHPPLFKVFNPVMAKTIADHPDLFQVNTPINVDVFKRFLEHHPNPSFVQSVCARLREGFWP